MQKAMRSIVRNAEFCVDRHKNTHFAAYTVRTIFGGVKLKESIYKSYDELPLFLNAETVAKALGVSPSSGYELMHEKGFPALRIGSRIVVPKEKFIAWVEQNTGGAV